MTVVVAPLPASPWQRLQWRWNALRNAVHWF
jgi:hypothetical protein